MTLPDRLAATCAACAGPLASAADTCPSCGSPVLPSARRVVTVAFADLAGYTAYCSERDPEDVHLLVRPLMNALRSLCEELGGLVPGIEGDGFMAAFGATETSADDPRHALLACARMQELVTARRAAAPDAVPALRVGVNIGEVIVAPSWERGGFSLSGDAVNLASRLCKAAEQGEVLASAAVVTCVPFDAWGPVRTLQVRGLEAASLAAPLRWRELVASAVVLRGESRTPYVAPPELDTVVELATARQPVVVLGESGVGKSRLLTEAVARLPEVVVLRTRFSPLEPGTAGTPALAAQLLREGADVGDLVGRRLRRLAGEVVDTDEVDTYAAQLEAVQEALGALAGTRGVVLVLDDVDQAAPTDIPLLAALVGAAAGVFALLMSARTEHALPDVHEIRLAPFERAAQETLVGHLLPGAPEALMRHIVERSGGVALFIEQYVRLLLEDGTVVLHDEGCTLVAPERLRALPTAMRLFVASRLDVLDPVARRVVAVAAVAGSTVDPHLLAFLSGGGPGLPEGIEALVGRGFLEWVPATRGSEPVLRFRHGVLREVAYEGLLKSHRIAIHRAAAEWYAVLPVVNLLAEEARHLEAALALGETDCGVVRRTVEVLGQHAASLVEENPALARDVIARAERLAAAHPACRADLLLVRVTAARELLHHGEEAAAAALAATVAQDAARRGRHDIEAVAWLTAGRAHVYAGEPAEEELDQAELLFRAALDETGVARVETARAEGPVPLRARLAAWERAYRAAMKGGERRLASTAAQDLAMHAAVQSPAEAETWRRVAVDLRRADDVAGEARLAVADALIALMRMDYAEAAAKGRQGALASESAGQRQLYLNASLVELEALVLSGRLDEAEERTGTLLEIARTRPTDYLRVDVLCCRALLLNRQGRGAEARAQLADVEEGARGIGPHYVAQWHAFSARVAQESGEFELAWQHAQTATSLELELDVPAWALRERMVGIVSRLAVAAHVGLGELSQARSDARVFGADGVAAVIARWGELADVLHGVASHELDVPEGPATTEVRALDLEIAALRERRPARLVAAAATWSEMGASVWQARALLWHSELTGTPSPEADELLARLEAPAGLAAYLRAQVRGLR